MEEKSSGAKVPPIGLNEGQGKLDGENAGLNALQELNDDINNNLEVAKLGLGTTYLPTDGLRQEVRTLIDNASYLYDAHRDKALMAAFMAVASVTGAKVSVKYKQYINHAALWGVIVDSPGGIKSSISGFFLDPVKTLDSNVKRNWNRKKKAAAPDERVDLPSRYVIGNCTMERLQQLIANSKTGILKHRDELNGMFKDFNRYTGARTDSSEMDMYLSLFDGKLESRDRVSDEEMLEKEDVAFSIFGTIQHKTFVEAFRGLSNSESGAFERFLYVDCKPRKRRYETDDDNDGSQDAEVWKTIIHDLDSLPEDTRYVLTEKATQMYKDYKNHEIIDVYNADMEMEHFMTRYVQKNAHYILRLALIIHLLNDCHDPQIHSKEMNMAIRCMRVFNEYAESCYNRIDAAQRPTNRQEINNAASMIRQMYLLNHSNGKSARQINQVQLANMLGVKQSLVAKIKRELLDKGLIFDELEEKASEEETPTEETKDETASEGASSTEPTNVSPVPEGGDNGDVADAPGSPTPSLPPKIRNDGGNYDNSNIDESGSQPPRDDGGDGYAYK